MKFTKAISSGLVRTYRSLKSILMVWVITFLAFATITIPLRSTVSAALGGSKATDMLSAGFDLDFWSDINSMAGFLPDLSIGVIFITLLLLIVYVFLNGGLFDSLRANSCSFTISNFFASSAKLFLSYMVATLLVLLMIIITVAVFIGVPVTIGQASGTIDSPGMVRLMKILRIVLGLVLIIFFLVIDYTRTWLAANDHRKVFKAMGYGFRATFKGFLGSYLFMLVIVILSVGFSWLSLKITGSMRAETGGALLLLFLVTQVLVFLRIAMKAWRYGGVTSMYEG